MSLWPAVAADVRQAVKMTLRTPWRAAATAVVAALGLSICSTAYSLVDILVLRPPEGVHEPSRLVTVPFLQNYLALERVSSATKTVELAASARQTISVRARDITFDANLECTTDNYFRVLAVQPVLGTVHEAPATVGLDEVVLNFNLWKNRFGANPGIEGTIISISGRPFAVAAVMPQAFRGLDAASTDLWIRLRAFPETCSFTGTNLLTSSAAQWLTTIGRLRPQASVEQAKVELVTLSDTSDSRDRHHSDVTVLRGVRIAEEAADAPIATWLLAGGLTLLLIACINTSGLLSIRTEERRQEFTMRERLGASGVQIGRQLACEHFIVIGLAVCVAWEMVYIEWKAVVASFPFLTDESALRGRTIIVLVLSAAVMASATLLGSLIQVRRILRAVRRNHSIVTASSTYRVALLIGQMSLSFVLVALATMFSRSLSNARQNLGYDADHAIVATLDLERLGIRRERQIRALFSSLRDRLVAIPGVEAVGWTTSPPLGTGRAYLVMPSSPGDGHVDRAVSYVSPDYFRAIGTRLVTGRAFRDDDPGESVAIVDEQIAAHLGPSSRDGQCVELIPASPCAQIIGVSESRKVSQLRRATGEVFFPIAEAEGRESLPQTIVVRGDVRRLLNDVRRQVQAVIPTVPPSAITPLAELVDHRARQWQIGMLLFSSCGGLAMALAASGIYTAVAFGVRSRKPEIVLRMALGATPLAVGRIVLKQLATAFVVSLGVGLPAAFLASWFIRSLLVGISTTDLVGVAAASTLQGGALVLGAIGPLLGALRSSPADMLRTT